MAIVNGSGLFKILGRKHVEQFGRWLPTLAVYGTTASLAGLYFTDWKAVLEYMPFYNGKFKEQ